jgi:hypothetical protein
MSLNVIYCINCIIIIDLVSCFVALRGENRITFSRYFYWDENWLWFVGPWKRKTDVVEFQLKQKKINYLLYCSLLYFYFMRWNVFQGRGLTDILRQDESWLVKLFLRLVEINFFENFLSIILSLVFKPPLFYDRWL